MDVVGVSLEEILSITNVRCALAIATYGTKMHKWIILVVNRRFIYCTFWISTDQKLTVYNKNKLFMHFLATSCNGQAAKDACNGQDFFWCIDASTIIPLLCHVSIILDHLYHPCHFGCPPWSASCFGYKSLTSEAIEIDQPKRKTHTRDKVDVPSLWKRAVDLNVLEHIVVSLDHQESMLSRSSVSIYIKEKLLLMILKITSIW